MRELTSGALLDALRGVHWPARRVVGGVVQGGHRSRRVGASPEFLEYRPYQQGDDPSRIDWKLFGRTERVAVRLTHDDASLRTMLLVDASASMAFPLETRAKWIAAASIALGLAAVAHGDGDPVGAAIVSDSVELIPARTRRGTVAGIQQRLVGIVPGGSTPLTPVLAAFRGVRRIAILSDFLGDAEGLLPVAGELVAGGAEMIAVHVVDPAELNPDAGGHIVVDPEDARVRRPLGETELPIYRERFAVFRAGLAAAWRGAGALYHEVSSAEPPDRVVRRITGSARLP